MVDDCIEKVARAGGVGCGEAGQARQDGARLGANRRRDLGAVQHKGDKLAPLHRPALMTRLDQVCSAGR